MTVLYFEWGKKTDTGMAGIFVTVQSLVNAGAAKLMKQ